MPRIELELYADRLARHSERLRDDVDGARLRLVWEELEGRVRAELGAFATSLAGRNPTADAIAKALGGVERGVQVEVPFSSRWKWSGLTLSSGETQVLGAPDVLLAQVADAASIGALVDVRAR